MELVFFYFDQFKAFSMLNNYYIYGLNFLGGSFNWSLINDQYQPISPG